ncbi:MAG: glycoside hydrolase family 28 protein [Melioribacter sp.]|uniref:glycoside hydrolase family 28 protein n=1 Tax=Rosettibacter primus TaxID=3111523 RepID=UPI00247C46EE|nr:glycoside hydrolase family 28 protein [Melioribacter sp.]
MKRTTLITLFILCISLFSAQAAMSKQYDIKKEIKKYYRGLEFQMPELNVPSFPDREFYITDFGAKGDGLTINTEAFAKAIDACSKSGGGKVIVPAGLWLTGPISLKSNVNLHLLQGAHIQFTKNFDDYPLVETTYEGTQQYRCTSPISGFNLENIAITGYGIIDGGGEAWRPVKKYKLTANQWKELVASGGVVDKSGNTWWPTEQAMNGEKIISELLKSKKQLTKEDYEKVRDFLRPVMVNLVKCKNILLDGVTFQNSPAWNLHPLMSENIIVRNVTVRNPWYSQNGDGIDVESCKNVIIYNSKFDVGDDAICMKSGRDEFGRKRGIPTENIIIADCIVYHGHGGFTIGSEMSGGVKNIKVMNCNFIGTDVGLRFKSTRGRGGVVENIFIENIYMKDIPTQAVSFNMYYGGAAPTEDIPLEEKSKQAVAFEVNEGTPIFRNIFLKNIYCIGAEDAVVLQGLPEMPIKNIVLNNVFMTSKKGISMFDAEEIIIKDTKIISNEPVIKISQSKNVTIENFDSPSLNNVLLQLQGDKTAAIYLKGINASEIMNKTKFADDVKKDVLIVK